MPARNIRKELSTTKMLGVFPGELQANGIAPFVAPFSRRRIPLTRRIPNRPPTQAPPEEAPSPLFERSFYRIVKGRGAGNPRATYCVTTRRGRRLFSVSSGGLLRYAARFYRDDSMEHEVLVAETPSVLAEVLRVLRVHRQLTVSEGHSAKRVGWVRYVTRGSAPSAWVLAGRDGREGGRIILEGAPVRSLLPMGDVFLPRVYKVEVAGLGVGVITETLFPWSMELDFSADTERRLDRRLALAGAILVSLTDQGGNS